MWDTWLQPKTLGPTKEPAKKRRVDPGSATLPHRVAGWQFRVWGLGLVLKVLFLGFGFRIWGLKGFRGGTEGEAVQGFRVCLKPVTFQDPILPGSFVFALFP